MKNTSFVIIGGGTGTFSVLSGLKEYTTDITAIVNMSDSGGSAKKERDEWGLLPSSDLRKSLIALADVSREDSLLLRKLFQYRYSEGVGLRGVTFGNLFLVALTKLLGSQAKAIEKAGEFLRIRGRVLPVTLKPVHLVATYIDGTRVIGEHSIDEPKHNGTVPIRHLSITPRATITSEAEKAIHEADAIIIGPGGFYTTILANFVVDGVADAVKKSSGKKIFIMNLMTEYGQTYQFSASRFLAELDTYFSTKYLDYVFINNAQIPSSIREQYHTYHAEPVLNDLSTNIPFQVIASDLLSKKRIKKEKGDDLRRSLIRHSPEKIAKLCIKVLGLI